MTKDLLTIATADLSSMFGDVVLGIGLDKFESLIEDKKKELKVESDTDLDAKALKELAERFKGVIKLEKGFEFPPGSESPASDGN